jgi:hypothetical protein
MSDFSTPARHTPGHDRFGPREQAAHGTKSGAGPTRPEEGSPLARLLSRHATLAGTGGLLGFVPAQVR